MDNDAATRRKATEYGGWVGDTILRLMDERDDARLLAEERLLGTALQQERTERAEAEREQLKAALQPYCWHIPGCKALKTPGVTTPGLPCDCGYTVVFNAIYTRRTSGEKRDDSSDTTTCP